MPFPRLCVAAVLALSAATAAHAATGSGQVHFEFTSFDGPFALTQAANVGDPNAWFLKGEVNGAQPTVNGHNTFDASGFVNIGGTAPLSGQTTTMVYANLPGAIPSVITFTPDSFSNISTGQAFRLGTLSYTNGQWVGGAPTPALNFPVNLGFHLFTTSNDTPAFNQSLSDAITVVTNQAGNLCDTPDGQKDEADFVYLASHPNFGSLRVYDQLCKPVSATNQGSVELWAKFGSLDLIDFRNPGGSGFLVDSTGVGAIGGGVPEPAAWALMILGFGAIGATARGRRRAAAAAA